MINAATELRETIKAVLPLLQIIDDDEASRRKLPDQWSKKEILGHLIDSACNNQQKFVRAMAQKDVDFVGYEQNFWVDSQKYDSESWTELIAFWYAYNIHLAHVIERVDPEVLSNTISIEGAGPFTLGFIMKDYVEHLKHHLNQILPGTPLGSRFQNIYNT